MQTSFRALDEAIKLTNRRVNALDNVVLPNLAAAIAYIDSELSELEREEIFRFVVPCVAQKARTKPLFAVVRVQSQEGA